MACRTLVLSALLLLCFAASASAATAVSIVTSTPSVKFGAPASLSGTAAPAGIPDQLVIEAKAASGAWSQLGAVATDAATGAWSYAALPREYTSYRVRTADGSAASGAVSVAVAPNLKLKVVGTPRAFVGASVVVRAFPSSFSGWVTLQSTTAAGRASTRVWVRNGRAQRLVRADAVGRARISASTRPTTRFAATRSALVVANVQGRTLREGARGPDVTALMKRLRALGFLTPGDGDRYTFAAGEATMAFHKAYGLERSYTWDASDWKRLSRLTRGPRSRYRTRATHLEVDKRRQIMMIVARNKPIAIIHVSTGLTGNTPEGRFRIYQRGGSYLLNFQAFRGNYGLHGYPSVPAYPASHGCVRQPNWASAFTWKHTSIGTPVYIY